MICDELRLTAFVNGELSQEEMEEVLNHLERCPSCDRALGQLIQLKTVAPRLNRELRSDDIPAIDPFRTRALPAGLKWMAVAAALMVMLGGLYLMRSYLMDQPGVRLAMLLENDAYEYIPPVYRGEPDDPDSARRELMSRYEREEYDGFIADGKAWLAAHPDDREIAFFAGVAAYVQRRYPEAESCLRASTSQGETPRIQVAWYLANTLLRQNRFPDARELLEFMAVQDHPYAPRARAILEVLDTWN